MFYGMPELKETEKQIYSYSRPIIIEKIKFIEGYYVKLLNIFMNNTEFIPTKEENYENTRR